jgi:dipeptidyl aminopeptidase/acylaminoacyl peptidase
MECTGVTKTVSDRCFLVEAALVGTMVAWLTAAASAFAADVLGQPSDEAARVALLSELRGLPCQILFEAYDKDNWELFIMNADGAAKRNLTQTRDIHELYPQASPDGTKICFLADTEENGATLRRLYYMNTDGTGRMLVADKAREACWSPDGTRIAFLKQEFDRFHITDYVSKGLYFYDLKTGVVTEHPNKELYHLYIPCWSSSGRPLPGGRIAQWIVSTVHAGMGFSHGILAIEVDGNGVYELPMHGCRPCLSADGAKITWSSDDHTVCVADIDLTGVKPEVSNVRTVHHDEVLHLYHPDFSPDGMYITFSVGPGGRVQAEGPGTHTELAEMIGVRGKWNLYLKRASGEGPAIPLTDDESMSNKESEWLPVRAAGKGP